MSSERGRRRGEREEVFGAGNRRLQVDERRSQLLELGIQLFSRHAYDELSIDDIAKAAGISKGLLYHYFPSKRHYYVETVLASSEKLLEATNVQQSEPMGRARAAIEAYLDFVDRHAIAFTTLLRSGIGFDPEVSSIVEGTRTRFVERVLQAKEGAASRTPRLRNALRGFIGFAEAAALDWLDHRDIGRPELRELLVDMLEQTLATAMRPATQ